MGIPVWFLVQNEVETRTHGPSWGHLADEVFDGFFKERSLLKKGGRVALLIDSPGGSARHAFKLAKILRNHAGGFTAVVPLYAKSAATLLALGADQILLAQDAELGPLDAQHFDAEREEYASALNEVQSLARLNADALAAIDSAMWLLGMRSGKKVSTLLPIATNFVIGMLGTVFDKLDTVHFSQMARMLKEAEDYAVRLLQPRYSEQQAKGIASHLVSNYPEHGFPIDPEEAATFGLLTIQPSPDELAIIEKLVPYLDKITAIGHLEEVPTP